MQHQHTWQPAEWDSRFERCKYCPAARYTKEEYERQCKEVDAGYRAAGRLLVPRSEQKQQEVA